MSNIKVTGRIRVEHFRNGILLKDSGWIENIVTTVGKNSLASLLNSTNAGNSVITYMGFGSSTTAVASTDTVLGTELSGNGYARVAVTRSNPSGNVVQYVATLTGITASTTVQEAGLFSALTGGTLFAHQLTGAYPLAQTADQLQVTWQITFS
jgi:hypothetical protein